MQWYAQDTIAADGLEPGDPDPPFDFSVDPDAGRAPGMPFGGQITAAANGFWFNQLGNVGMIGYSGAHDIEQTLPYLTRACKVLHAAQPDVRVLLLVGHWDVDNLGCETRMDVPGLYSTVAGLIVPQLTTTDTPEFVQGINVPVISISRTAAAALSDALAASAAGVNLTLVHPAGAPRLLWGGEMGGAGSATVDLRTFGTRYFELRPTGEERELRFEVRPPLGAAPAELTVFAAAFGAGVPPSSSTAPTADAHALGGVQTAGGTRLLLLRALEPLEASALCAGCTVLVGVYTEEALAAVQVRALASHAFTLAADEPRADATGGAGADSLGGARYFRVEVDVASGPMRLELELNSTDGQLLELFAALD